MNTDDRVQNVANVTEIMASNSALPVNNDPVHIPMTIRY
ncbi:hypothetical protein SeGA_1108 [Salmonella enterica subsp. enterica serovar Gaminara str. A4-567]|nr:hypothetical protein SeGA_1108 [Salmonella enterica subsp. enterica serovar Gaminara str. A4-567]